VVKEFSEIPLIKADAGQIEQVFLNLILNSIQAMGEGGKLVLGTKCHPESCLSADRFISGSKVEYVITEITDTGHGIPKEDLEKIFDAFYTTKEEGTGLGLSTSYRIIEEHRGKIEVESELGKGTTFVIKLPFTAFT
jgi:signal transduction histidine kinase